MGDNRGFALLEVLVAFIIAALALGLLFRAAAGGMTAVAAAGRYEEAVSRAKSHLAAIGRDVTLAEGIHEGDDGGGFAWRIVITAAGTAQPPPIAAGAAPPQGPSAAPAVLYAIDVSVSWREDGHPRDVVLHTARVSSRRAP